MDLEIIREMENIDTSSIEIIEYAQKCIYFYEETLKAMGLLLPDTVGYPIDNSNITYTNPIEIKEQYADISEHY
ncbi:MAG TPA: hypothetical protein PLX23_04375 [Candidatus Hydrogenedens sp.]|nr:hypothetical protein [Candidatus Hydrogenedens sp.]